MSVEFEDNRMEIQSAIADIAYRVLEEVGGEFEAAVKRNTAVDTGQTKNSWTHRVYGSMMAEQYIMEVGSNYENAIWEEFGTGEYALNGDGRKGGWVYRDQYGLYWYTKGKPPRRPLHKAYTKLRNKMIKHVQEQFKGGLS